MRNNKQLKGFQGIFLEKEIEQQLIALQKRGLDNNIENMHITFKFGDIEKYPEKFIEREFEFKVTGYGSDGKNSGFSVELPEELRRYYKSSSIPHITVSIGEVDGVKGKLVDTAKLDFRPLDKYVKIKGKLGYFIFGKGMSMNNEIINEYQLENLPQNSKVLLVPKYMSEAELADVQIIPTATVEAEYGEKVIQGEQVTLAHYAKEYENNPALYNTLNVPVLDDDSTIIVSHLNLDTIEGIAALIGRKKEESEFWKTVEFIGLNGSHNLFQVEEEAREKYIAYQAYQINHRKPKFTEITDVTAIVLEHLKIIDRIIDGDKTLIQEGIKWAEETKRKIEECLVFENDNVRVFNSPEGVFCSEAYYSEKQGKVIPSTVTRNGKSKSVTVAMADGGKKVSAKELVQELWGNEAGGLLRIAGSPRGQEMTEKDMQQLANIVNERYSKINEMNEPIYFEPDEVLVDD